jgi:hypothetical protein
MFATEPFVETAMTEAANQGKVEGIRRAMQGVSEEWKERAREAVLHAADLFDEFTADDVWTYSGLKFPEVGNRSALGGIFLQLAKAKLIEFTGQTRQSQRKAHHRRVSVWRRVYPSS